MDDQRRIAPPAGAPPSARWWVAAAVIVVAALTVAVLVHPGPLPGELGYVRWLQRRDEPVPTVADMVRMLTGTEGSLLAAVLPAVWLIWRIGRRGLSAVAIALIAMLAVQPIFKEAVDRPRPSAELVEVRADHSSRSFPSGHSLSTATVWGSVAGLSWRRGRRGLATSAVGPIALTGIASGVQGVHWPSDALAGTLVGAVAALLIVRVVDSGPDPLWRPWYRRHPSGTAVDEARRATT